VGFFSNPHHAQLLAQIPRHAHAFRGRFEQRSAVTIFWVRLPPKSLRASVEACVFR
jgi:hypothetical protein